MNRYRTIAAATLLGVLLAACDRSPPAADPAAANGNVAKATATAPASTDTLRQRAEQAMREQRLFVPAGNNALEHYLALRRQHPDDAGAEAGLVDLQPLLVIAIEQAIASGALPEGRRLVGHLQEMDANAPALVRLQATMADAERLAQLRAQATDAESLAKADADAAALRRQAKLNAERLAAARTAPSTPPAANAVTGAAAIAAAPALTPPPAPAPPRQPAPAPPRQPAPAQTRPEPVAATPPPASAPTRAAAQSPRLLRDVAPVYPRSGRLSGQVQVAFTIGADGSVENPEVVNSTLPNAFDRAALTAVARWKFEASGSRHQSQRTLLFAPPSS